jgi:hypothetical protein
VVGSERKIKEEILRDFARRDGMKVYIQTTRSRG